jgi:hypothetical protein
VARAKEQALEHRAQRGDEPAMLGSEHHGIREKALYIYGQKPGGGG